MTLDKRGRELLGIRLAVPLARRLRLEAVRRHVQLSVLIAELLEAGLPKHIEIEARDGAPRPRSRKAA